MLTTYFRRLPEEVIEAALIDGLGYFKIFFRIMLPLAVPAIAAVVVLQFIQIWNDLLVGLLFLQTPQLRPITVGLATVAAQHTLDVPVLMAGSLASAMPEILVFLVFQRYLIAGLTMGMSK
jgi:ABC-type glycerol-3-phosphate transport system permease component